MTRQLLKGRKNPWLLAGMAVGIIAILVGLAFLFGFKDEIFYGSSSSASGGTTRLGTAAFGADFYTDIYKSTTFAGNAVKGVYELLSTCFGMLFLLLGAADLCFFGSRLPQVEKSVPPATPAAPQTPEEQKAPGGELPVENSIGTTV